MVQGKCTCRAIEVISRSLMDDLKINSRKSPKKNSQYSKSANFVKFLEKKIWGQPGSLNLQFLIKMMSQKNVHVPFECHVQVNSIFIGGLQVKLVQVYCIYLNFVLQRWLSIYEIERTSNITRTKIRKTLKKWM